MKRAFLIITASLVAILAALVGSRITHSRFSVEPSESYAVQSKSEDSESVTQRRAKRLTARNPKLPPGSQHMTSNDLEALQLLREDRFEEAMELFLQDEPGAPPSGGAPSKGTIGTLRSESEEWITDPKKREEIERFLSKCKEPDIWRDENPRDIGRELRLHLIELYGREWWDSEGIMLSLQASGARSFAGRNPMHHDQILALAREGEHFLESEQAFKIPEKELRKLPELRERIEAILGQKTDAFYLHHSFTMIFPPKIDWEELIKSVRRP